MKLPLEPHGWHHIEFGVYILAILFILYMPPKMTGLLAILKDFMEKHFGDGIGLYLLHLGVGLIILGSVFPDLVPVKDVGQSLVLAAMGLLKLPTSQPPPEAPKT